MLEYRVTARRLGPEGSLAQCKAAQITLDTALPGRPDAFNPAELLLAALAACIIKNIERVAPILHFEFHSVEVRVHGARQDSPPKMASIAYEVVVGTQESDRRLELLHENIQKFGTIYNTLAASTELSGTLRRAEMKAP